MWALLKAERRNKTKKILKIKLKWKRPTGRTRPRWEEQVRKDVIQMEVRTWEETERKLRRDRWKGFVARRPTSIRKNSGFSFTDCGVEMKEMRGSCSRHWRRWEFYETINCENLKLRHQLMRFRRRWDNNLIKRESESGRVSLRFSTFRGIFRKVC